MKKLWCVLVIGSALTVGGVAQEEATIEIIELLKTKTSWDGSTLSAYGEGKPEVTVLKATIPPGEQLPLHEHPVINAAYILSGDLTVVTEEGKTLHMSAGNAFAEVVDRWHYGKNEGDEPVELIVFYAGLVDTPITISEPANSP